MGVVGSARIVHHAVAVGLFAMVLARVGVGQVAPPPVSTIHVAVRVFDHNGEPVGELKPDNFRLTPPGFAPLQATVSTPPVHLLVLLAAGQGDLARPVQADWVRGLEPLWKAGWWISVRDAAGRQTPYLASDLGLGGVAAVRASIPAAVGTLAEFTGRRVVFVVTGRAFGVDDSTVRLARRYHAMLYQVGTARSNRFQPAFERDNMDIVAMNSNGDVVAQAIFPGLYYSASSPTPYVHEEKSFRAAARHALADGTAFYDLRADVPADIHALALSLHLTHPGDNRYRVEAQPYAEEHVPLPTVTIETR